MKVMQFNAYGGPAELVSGEAPLPEPGEGQIRVAIAAAAVNPADPKWRQGMFQSFAPVSFPHVPGYDIAGRVDAVGPGVATPRPGDRVVVMLNAMTKGGYADYAVAPAADAVPVPEALGFATAAALPTAGLTGVQMVEDYARVTSGQRILITGATGGVGRFALYAARLAGADVVAAVRASQVEEALSLGAAETLVLGEEDWSGDPFDHIIDTVGGPAVAALCRHVREDGGIFTASTTPIDPEGLPSVPVFVVVRNDVVRLAALAEAVVAGALAVPIARRMPLAEAAEAHALVEAGGLGGKIILIP